MADNILKINVDLNIYKQETITAAVYNFTRRCFVEQHKIDNGIEITFTSKPEQSVNFDLLAKEFNNELIDRQICYDTEQKFGEIRNLIVKKAFAPIS